MGDILDVTFTPSLDTAVYASGDILFATTLLQSAVKRGRIKGITIIDKDDLGENCDLYFLNSSSSFGTRNAVPSMTDAAAESIIGIMSSITASKDIGGVRVATYEFEMSFDIQSSGSLYIAGVTNTALNHTAAGVVFTFRIEKES